MPFLLGKLPPNILGELLGRIPLDDPDIVVGPGIGMDCAVLRFGDRLLIAKSDPVTLTSDGLGHYLVSVNANDVATTGARPRWLLVTLLLPEQKSDLALVSDLMDQINRSCRELGIALVGGHTEITSGLDRPIAVGALLGEVEEGQLITPRGARPGDRILLTKGVPIEGTAIIGREMAEELTRKLGSKVAAAARAFAHQPGISVTADARIATAAAQVTAMHDPTEGGLITALWELAEASNRHLAVDPAAVPIPELSRQICSSMNIDPLATIASGALLVTAAPEDAARIKAALLSEGIACADIGTVGEGPAGLERLTNDGYVPWPMPERDELARLLENRGG
ncbi:AIR synthase family protein [Thiohalomonas denitrificans]|uniref:Hydrogenase maturation factor n=1 Tax=Thiohalomonas denitrificans TaxID=415747 RepID=A0A1G5QL23_9GAMM|nr:AIR synthase family protein [Thiohalomonas denitrificans]SCZ62260.1 Hydrogenase maturation factor [Thiohalomonas denitrificans]